MEATIDPLQGGGLGLKAKAMSTAGGSNWLYESRHGKRENFYSDRDKGA